MIKVLIVEDELTIAQMYQLKCELTGVSAKIAGNGQEALDMLASFRPDIILLDIQMPVMNGADFLRIFHSKEENKRIPVLILTNTGAEEAPASMWGTGIAGYIIKADTTPSEVISKIKSIVESSNS